MTYRIMAWAAVAWVAVWLTPLPVRRERSDYVALARLTDRPRILSSHVTQQHPISGTEAT